jgi:hypothetical protein
MLFQSENEDSQFGGLLAVLGLMGMDDVTQRIRSSDKDKFVGIDCSPGGSGSQCTASPMCCENNYFVGVCRTAFLALLTFTQGGLLAIGCSNFDLEFPIDAGR